MTYTKTDLRADLLMFAATIQPADALPLIRDRIVGPWKPKTLIITPRKENP